MSGWSNLGPRQINPSVNLQIYLSQRTGIWCAYLGSGYKRHKLEQAAIHPKPSPPISNRLPSHVRNWSFTPGNQNAPPENPQHHDHQTIPRSLFKDRHPGYKFLGRNKTGRNLKKTLLSFEDEVQDHFRTEKYKTVVRNIHTKTVQSTISNYPVNRVLNCNPPVINKIENTLDRRTRVQLARLRSGFSRLLQSYMSRIDDKEVDECPLCKAPNHDVNHLFNCDKNPTHLSPLDLWNNPTEAAKFLKLPDGWDAWWFVSTE